MCQRAVPSPDVSVHVARGLLACGGRYRLWFLCACVGAIDVFLSTCERRGAIKVWCQVNTATVPHSVCALLHKTQRQRTLQRERAQV
ncbi:unnamed protein product [Leptosia nina]|uniref:Secreted protein n=1 Tax=Leptosia nina TaxID=320188 RepID=A0AAV1J348_9NEOP